MRSTVTKSQTTISQLPLSISAPRRIRYLKSYKTNAFLWPRSEPSLPFPSQKHRASAESVPFQRGIYLLRVIVYGAGVCIWASHLGCLYNRWKAVSRVQGTWSTSHSSHWHRSEVLHCLHHPQREPGHSAVMGAHITGRAREEEPHSCASDQLRWHFNFIYFLEFRIFQTSSLCKKEKRLWHG